MRKIVTLTTATALALGFAFSVVGVGSAEAAEFQAYSISGGTLDGNQGYTGALGNDFDVNSPIAIISLGVFDDDADGISGSIDVHIFDLINPVPPLASKMITGAGDPLMGEFRFKDITPLILAPGNYSVVAYGFDGTDENGNENVGDIPLVTDGGGGLISFIDSRFGGADPTVTFPTSMTVGIHACSGQPEACFAAGSFKYVAAAIENDGCDVGGGGNDVDTVEAYSDGTTIFVHLTLCNDIESGVKYRVHFDYTDQTDLDEDATDEAPDTPDSDETCQTTSDDTMMRRGTRETGPGIITEDTDMLWYEVDYDELTKNGFDLVSGDQVLIWVDTQFRGINDRAPNTQEPCSKPQTLGEVIDLTLE